MRSLKYELNASRDAASHFRCFRPPGPRPRNAIRLSDELRPGRARCALSQVTCKGRAALIRSGDNPCREVQGNSPERDTGTIRAIRVLAGAPASSADSRAPPTVSLSKDAVNDVTT